MEVFWRLTSYMHLDWFYCQLQNSSEDTSWILGLFPFSSFPNSQDPGLLISFITPQEKFFFRRQYVLLLCSGCHNKIPLTGWLRHRNLYPCSSGVWKSKIKVSSGLVSSEASFRGLQMAAFSLLSSCGLFVVCMSGEREISGVFSSSDKDTSPIGLGPHPYNLACNLAYNLNYLL